ncbi:MAG: ABC transporter permease [Bacteroidia bacterium]|nr:ABC transporter permease [Bacteroidia bacterium]
MFERDNWQEIFATMRKNKVRTFLSAFGVGWGIFMLIIMLGAGSGLRNGVLKEFAGGNTNSFFIWTQKTSKPYKGMQPGRNFNFRNGDIAALQQLPELESIGPLNQLGGFESGNNVVRGVKTTSAEVMGEFPVMTKIQEVKMVSGRFLNENDIREKRKVAVIGRRVAQHLFKKGEDPVNQYIKVNGIYFKVVGQTTPASDGDQAREQESQIHIPFTTFQSAFNFGNIVGWFAITAKKDVPASVAEKRAIEILKERHQIAPEDMMALGHWNMQEEFTKLNGLFSGIEVLVWFVGVGTLLAGVIGISNIMLIVVKERTKEIGVKRALGATPMNIITQLIIESVFLTAIAGFFGLMVGYTIIETLRVNMPAGEGGMFSNPEIKLDIILKSLGLLIGAGALAGLIPAKKATDINPVEALRSE